MFYSHQLLSKKGPLSQIWIAATMHAKINRKRAQEIDIPEICKQIMNPVVPLALRLSGILMGGVVLIYNRKVKFFSDDVNNLLIQIKTLPTAKGEDSTSLPKEKFQARFEAITIDYRFEDYDEIERLMFQPSTPPKDDLVEDEYFIIPEHAENGRKKILEEHKFQAERENITLEEETLKPHQHIPEFGREDNDDRIPPPDEVVLENLCPEFQIFQDEIPAGRFMETQAEPLNIHTQEKLAPDTEAEAPKSPQPEVPPQHRKPRPRRRGKRSMLLDEDYTEIPGREFNSWLQNSSDIVKQTKGRKKPRVTNDMVHSFLLFPSTSLHWSRSGRLESGWPSQLLTLWECNIFGRQKVKIADDKESGFQDQRTRKSSEAAEEHDGIAAELRSGQQLAAEDSSLIRGAELLQEFQEDNMNITMADYNEYGSQERLLRNSAPPGDYREFGSVEKLRSALRTANTGSEEEFLANQLGLTPIFSGRGQNSRRSQITSPGSGQLQLEMEGEFPVQGGINSRSNKSARHSDRLRKSVSPSFDYLPEDFLQQEMGTPRLMTGPALVGSSGSGNARGGTTLLTLSQFELEETGPSQEPGPQESINKITASMLQFLREQFHLQPARQLSCNGLGNGLDRCQAAKMFYQICVLASNRFIRVEQKEAYGDIILARGAYL